MPHENPWAYNEARDRIREKKEQEVHLLEVKKEEFEKSKEKIRKWKSLDVHSLRQKMETWHSLNTLRSDIINALKEWNISRETYDQFIASLDREDMGKSDHISTTIDPDLLPFSHNQLAKYLENKKLGENIWADIVWFLYGFFIQGSAILIIIAWKILMDLLKLPIDMYDELKSKK